MSLMALLDRRVVSARSGKYTDRTAQVIEDPRMRSCELSCRAGLDERRSVVLALKKAPAATRHEGRDIAREWRVSAECVSRVELLTSELVTNAVLAAGRPRTGRGWFSVPRLVSVQWSLYGHAVYVEVHGGWNTVPVLGEVDVESENGRGLYLVDAFSSDWGWIPSKRGGIIVWSVIPR